jgi:cell division protein FtsW
LGQSRQKYLWLPQSYTDTILAIIGEEMGLIGTLFVVGSFIFLAYRGFKIASSAPNTFGALLATGITLWLVVQAIINLAVVTSLAPFTGITLPFLSYGGTSLMISMVSAGILLNISKYTLADDARPGVLRLAYERFRTLIAALAPFWRRDGRHVYPSLAVAASLASHPNSPRLAYVGSPDGMEGDLVRRESTLPFCPSRLLQCVGVG